jgi:hypothetical protein
VIEAARERIAEGVDASMMRTLEVIIDYSMSRVGEDTVAAREKVKQEARWQLVF